MIAKIVFFLSFVPAAAAFVVSCVNAVGGTTFMFSKVYGVSAFLLTILVSLYYGCAIAPVFPLCLLYQILYFVYPRRIKGKVDGRKFAAIMTGVVCLICSGYLVVNLLPSAEDYLLRRKISAMADRSEEIIPFNTNEIFASGIMNLEQFRTDSIILDYDTHEVGILVYLGYTEYYQYKLQEAEDGEDIYRELKTKYHLQSETALKNNGVLYTFSPSEDYSGKTCAICWVEEGGKAYYQDGLSKDTDHSVYTGLGYE